MVQQSCNLKVSATEEMHEFQLVHAIITQTQHIDGCEDLKKSGSFDNDDSGSTDDTTASAILHIDVVSTICQKFHTVAGGGGAPTTNRKRVVPTYMKNFLDYKRSNIKPNRYEKDDENSTASSSSSSNEHDKKIFFVPLDVSSNVQQKVLHFEQCANSQQISVVDTTDALRSNLDIGLHINPNQPVLKHDNPADGPGAEERQEEQQEPVENRLQPNEPLDASGNVPPGGNPDPGGSSPRNGGVHHHHHHHHQQQQQPQMKPVQLTGRNLKRVPSERFQEMRKKVQRLMQHQNQQDDVDRCVSPEIEEDEATFLKSIRVLLPAHNQDPCRILRLPDHALCKIFTLLDTKTLASLKMTCSDFNYVINFYDVRGTDSMWTKDKRYIDDPCKQCRRLFTPGDQSMCRYHPKRYYSDLPYGRSYWMCCLQAEKSASGCQVGIHDNHWLAPPSQPNDSNHANT